MRNARSVEDEPLRLGDRTLIADCQRHEHASVGFAVERPENARADRFARTLNVVAGPACECVDPRVAGVGSHVAGGA